MKKLYIWAREKVRSPYALIVFAFLAFIEAVLFMPVNTLLIIYGIEWPKRAWTYATIALVASVIGAAIAYVLGLTLSYAGAQQVLYWFFSPAKLEQLAHRYCQNTIVLVFTYSLLPLPFKLITLSAGFFHVPFIPFILSVIGARFIRFFSIALGIRLWGERIQKIVDRHFMLFVCLTIVTLAIMIWFFYFYP